MDKLASTKEIIGSVQTLDTTDWIQPGIRCIARMGQGERSIIVRVHHRSANSGFYECYDESNNHFYYLYRQQLMAIPSVPSRFNYRHFERYAPTIGAALRAYPHAIPINPGRLSVETVARGIREAIEAKSRYAYVHPSIDEKLFALHHDELSTAMEEGRVIVGTRAAIRAKRHELTLMPLDTKEVPREIEVLPGVLEHICIIIDQKALSPVPRFVVTFPSNVPVPQIIESYETRYNVVFAKLETGESRYEIT